VGVIYNAYRQAVDWFLDRVGAGDSARWEHYWIERTGEYKTELADKTANVWRERVRADLVAAGASEDTLRVIESFIAAGYPTGMLSTLGVWIFYTGAKLTETAKVLASEGVYKLLHETRPSRPSTGDVWSLVYAGGLNADTARDALRDQGWSEAYIDAYEQAAHVYTDVSSALELYRRGELDDHGFRERLSKLGFSTQAMSDIEKLKDRIPGPGDLVSMAVREAWRDDVASKYGYDQDFPGEFAAWLNKQGLSPEWATRYWRAHWTLPSITQGYELFQRGIISEEDLRTLLRVSDIPAYWRDALVKGSYRTLTRVDVRRMYELGVLDRDGVYQEYRNYGYSPENAERMTEFTVRYVAESEDSKVGEFRTLTRSVITQAYRKSLLTRDQASTRLQELEYTAEDAALLLGLEDWNKEIGLVEDPTEDFAKEMERIVETGYDRSILGRQEAESLLHEIGWSQEAIAYKLQTMDFWRELDAVDQEIASVAAEYTARAINRGDAVNRLNAVNIPTSMQESLLARWNIERRTRDRRATEAQYRKAMLDGTISVEEYKENLRGLGYTEYDVWLYAANALGVEEAGAKPSEGPLSP